MSTCWAFFVVSILMSGLVSGQNWEFDYRKVNEGCPFPITTGPEYEAACKNSTYSAYQRNHCGCLCVDILAYPMPNDEVCSVDDTVLNLAALFGIKAEIDMACCKHDRCYDQCGGLQSGCEGYDRDKVTGCDAQVETDLREIELIDENWDSGLNIGQQIKDGLTGADCHYHAPIDCTDPGICPTECAVGMTCHPAQPPYCQKPPPSDGPICNVNEYVQGGKCEWCPTGTIRPVKDIVEKGETECTTCAENYHVEEKQCTRCADGKVNDAGDDSTGADTQCTAYSGAAGSLTSGGEMMQTDHILLICFVIYTSMN